MTDDSAPDPLRRFGQWFESLPYGKEDMQRTAMSLATSSREGIPSVRVVLLKGYDARGFVFFTNMESHKSHDLMENPQACLNFSWIPLGRQVRVTGKAKRVSDEEADEYYASRPLVSRIGAWASTQSHLLPARQILLDKVKELQQRYSESNPPPRPSHWSGWRIVPQEIEFWQEADYRLHDRDLFTRTENGWHVHKLYP